MNADVSNLSLIIVVPIPDDANLVNWLMTALTRLIGRIDVDHFQVPLGPCLFSIGSVAQRENSRFKFLFVITAAH